MAETELGTEQTTSEGSGAVTNGREAEDSSQRLDSEQAEEHLTREDVDRMVLAAVKTNTTKVRAQERDRANRDKLIEKEDWQKVAEDAQANEKKALDSLANATYKDEVHKLLDTKGVTDPEDRRLIIRQRDDDGNKFTVEELAPQIDLLMKSRGQTIAETVDVRLETSPPAGGAAVTPTEPRPLSELDLSKPADVLEMKQRTLKGQLDRGEYVDPASLTRYGLSPTGERTNG